MAIDTTQRYLVKEHTERGRIYDYIDLGPSAMAMVIPRSQSTEAAGLAAAEARGVRQYQGTDGTYYHVMIQRMPKASLLSALFGGIFVVSALLTLGIRASHGKLGLDDHIATGVVGGAGLVLFGVGVKRTWWPAREWVVLVTR